jgi:hypothetical protein
MTTLIENAVTLADIAKTMKTTATRVEAEAHELDMFIGSNWAGAPALSVVDAHAYVSGDARRGHEHAAAHRHWRTADEAWQSEREQVRRRAYGERFDAARRRGVGDPQASSEAAGAASAAIIDYERKTPQPVFGVVESPRPSMRNRVREVVKR